MNVKNFLRSVLDILVCEERAGRAAFVRCYKNYRLDARFKMEHLK